VGVSPTIIPLISHTRAADLDRLFNLARGGKGANELVRLMMEPTGMGWHPVCVYAQKRGVELYLVSTARSQRPV